jgi:hypothetical protein
MVTLDDETYAALLEMAKAGLEARKNEVLP